MPYQLVIKSPRDAYVDEQLSKANKKAELGEVKDVDVLVGNTRHYIKSGLFTPEPDQLESLSALPIAARIQAIELSFQQAKNLSILGNVDDTMSNIQAIRLYSEQLGDRRKLTPHELVLLARFEKTVHEIAFDKEIDIARKSADTGELKGFEEAISRALTYSVHFGADVDFRSEEIKSLRAKCIEEAVKRSYQELELGSVVGNTEDIERAVNVIETHVQLSPKDKHDLLKAKLLTYVRAKLNSAAEYAAQGDVKMTRSYIGLADGYLSMAQTEFEAREDFRTEMKNTYCLALSKGIDPLFTLMRREAEKGNVDELRNLLKAARSVSATYLLSLISPEVDLLQVSDSNLSKLVTDEAYQLPKDREIEVRRLEDLAIQQAIDKCLFSYEIKRYAKEGRVEEVRELLKRIEKYDGRLTPKQQELASALGALAVAPEDKGLLDRLEQALNRR